MARATEEKLQQMSDKVEATDNEREKNIKKDMQGMKQRYDTVNNKLWSLETRIDTMSKGQAEKSRTIQSKLDALLRNSAAQDKLATDRTQGNRVNFVETQRNKRESSPLRRGEASIGPLGPDNYEEWNLKYDKWTRGFHNEQQCRTRCLDVG